MKMKRDKNQKGITLIALVITIIVMLILVAVTISMAINGGLFEYAKDAATRTEAEKANENTLGEGNVKVEGLFDNESTSINDIVDHYKE